MTEPTPESVEITVSEAADLAPAALAAAGAELHADAADQISRHADRVEREWAMLLEENRTLREQHHALTSEIAEMRQPPDPPDVIVMEVPAEPAPDVDPEPEITEVDAGPEVAPAETEDAHEAKKRRRKPFGNK